MCYFLFPYFWSAKSEIPLVLAKYNIIFWDLAMLQKKRKYIDYLNTFLFSFAKQINKYFSLSICFTQELIVADFDQV